MRRAAGLLRDFHDAGAMSSLINLHAFVDDRVFMTKGGDVGIVLALAGADYECLDAEQREAVTRRFEVALRILDEHTRLYQYVLKRHTVVPPPAGDVASPSPAGDAPAAVQALLRRRQAFFKSREAELYSVNLYLVVVTETMPTTGNWMTSFRDWFSTARTVVRLDGDIERRRITLRRKVDAFAGQLQDTLRPRVLLKRDAFTFMRRLLNYEPGKADAVSLREDAFLDFDAADSALECHPTHLRLDDYYVRVLTLKEPPALTFPHLFQALYEIPSRSILVSQWQREGQGAVRREIHAKRRHFHNARVSLANYVTDATTAPSDLLVDDSASALVRDLGACLTELTLQGRYFGQYTMTVVLYDRDPATLERSVAACTKAFAAHDAQVTDERYNLLNAWLAVLPCELDETSSRPW